MGRRARAEHEEPIEPIARRSSGPIAIEPRPDPDASALGDEDVEILVADDREVDLVAIETILAAASRRIVTASSGREALRRVLERDFAVILLDVVMGDMDGFEVASIIKQRERSRHTPIIFLTSAGLDVGFIYRGYSVGAVDYLVKPIDADVLRAKVEIFTALHRKDRRIQRQAEALREAERREREVALSALRVASERRYRNLAEAIPQIVWTAQRDGTVTYVNRRWHELTGQTRDEARDRGWLAMIHPDDAFRVVEEWRSAVDAERDLAVDARIRARDGRYRWHLCRAVAERDEQGVVVGWLGTCTDFDDTKRAHAAAEAAVHARDEFLSIASHELRTPLTTLRLRLQSLERSSHPSGDRDDLRLREKVESALRQTNRLASLVDSLLDVSRITTGTIKLYRERFDLAEAAREVVDGFAEAASAAGCTITLEASPGLSGCWDRLRVEQVLQNLVGNALKYAAGSAIEVVVAGGDGIATVSVADRGAGIAPEDVERIFARFERAAPMHPTGGLGLGLYISRQIASAHGGTLTLVTTPGEGSTFTLSLPMAAG
ncbi:MAG: response regulator [Deltaproteobacteria bacterium]|nr:response regulator [Deltaproteobacteria bacterium]